MCQQVEKTDCKWRYQAAGRLFRLSPEQLDAIGVAAIIFYKIGVLLFNLVPYLALRLVG